MGLFMPEWASSLAKFCLLCGISLVAFFVSSTAGQVAPGYPSFSAYDSHEVDTVNLANLNVVLNMPVMAKAGAFPFRFSLTGGDSYVYPGSSSLEPGVLAVPLVGSANGILGIEGNGLESQQIANFTCANGTGVSEKWSNWVLVFADGTIHPLPASDFVISSDLLGFPGNCPTSFTDTTIDGSGYTVTVTGCGDGPCQKTVTIYDRSGMNISNNGIPSTISDSNGNTLSYDLATGIFTDTLGVTALTMPYGSLTTAQWTDAAGSSSPPKLIPTNTSYTLRSAFGCSGRADYNIAGSSLPTNLSYPDGTAIGITYEQTPGYPNDVTGRVATLTLREGGTITYNYNPSGAANDGLNCTYLVPAKLTRTTSDGTTTYTLAYSQISGPHYEATNTVVDQGGNQTVYTFTGFTGAGNAALPAAQVLTQVQRSKGTSLLTTDVYCYNTAFANCSVTAAPTATVSLPIQSVVVFHQINGMSNWSATEVHYDSYGNVIYSAEYDFGASSPTIATTTTYGSCSAGCATAGPTISSIGNYVNNKPGEIVTTAGGSTVGQSNYTYDAHGNLLTTYAWNGSAWLSNPTPNTYNANGTISTSYDVAGNATTYSYNSSSYVSCGSCTNFPFPTSITKGGLTSSSTWNGVGGVKLSDTDPNGKTTNYGYTSSGGTADPFWRVMSVTDPLGYQAYKTYPTGSSPDTANSSFTFGVSIQNTTATTDGYGRTINVQREQGPSSTSYDTTSTQYLWSGNYRELQTTLPCTATSGSQCPFSPGVTTALLDPLRRPYTVTDGGGGTVTNTYQQNDVLTVLGPAPAGENTKQVQKQYDGLGRVTMSCTIGNGYTTGCNQNTGSANGVTTSYSYPYGSGSSSVSVTRGSQTRSKTYDAMRRLTSSSTPEGGTTTYTYDSYPSGCGGYTSEPGHLMLKTTPIGTICYVYNDGGLGRLTDVWITGGANNYCKRFRYDSVSNGVQTQPSGSTINNAAGRLVEAETDNCGTPSTMITDEWFSYDADGHMTDMWELTPNSGQYYHSTATFYGNGAVDTLTLVNPSLYWVGYQPDGEGRPYGLIAVDSNGDGTPIVAWTTYNAASQPTEIALEGTDQDDYVYDANTGRMTQFTFQVGKKTPATLVGNLQWNANGTLNNLAITDGFNSGGTQTCYYNPTSGGGMGYDDWGRLLNVSCGASGSTWNQTFSYDQYDNLTKSSSGPGVSWNPGYNPSNNQYQLAGTSYDADGDLLTDTFHTYTWSTTGKMASVDQNGSGCSKSGECIIYDALDRPVEIDKKTTYTEIWYTQLGKTAYMDGSTIKYAYWPAPGGGTGVVSGNDGDTYYMHKDWLGNARIVSHSVTKTVFSDQAYAPYGEIYDQFGSKATEYQMFTGDTQDIVSGMMDTPNREYNSAEQGRWLSPDPAGSGWNQYAYATNPNSFIDPTGLYLAGPQVAILLTAALGWEAVAGAAGMAMLPETLAAIRAGVVTTSTLSTEAEYTEMSMERWARMALVRLWEPPGWIAPPWSKRACRRVQSPPHK
jgi:RHS repeat-associated protein